VIVRSYYEGQTYHQIGAAIGISKSRAEQLRQSALKRLRESLSEYHYA
jgi:DNA-directed RNA polymerase specialized sigma subunit